MPQVTASSCRYLMTTFGWGGEVLRKARGLKWRSFQVHNQKIVAGTMPACPPRHEKTTQNARENNMEHTLKS